MQMKISVDCSRTQLPLSEYLCTIVCNNFDVIEDKKTPFLEKSISLRCYNRSTFRGVPNTFYAFVAFDRFFDASGDPEKRAKKRSASSILRVRYVISVKTSQAVEDKAEVILRTVLEKFKS
jgi:hypothetical protein